MVTPLSWERVRPAQSTGMAAAVHESRVPLFKKRGRIVILSDFLDDTGAIIRCPRRSSVHRKYEVLLLQIADPDELNLPAFNAAKFVDLEERQKEAVQVDPEGIRAAYQAHMQAMINNLAREADLQQIQHRLIDTPPTLFSARSKRTGIPGDQWLRGGVYGHDSASGSGQQSDSVSLFIVRPLRPSFFASSAATMS